MRRRVTPLRPSAVHIVWPSETPALHDPDRGHASTVGTIMRRAKCVRLDTALDEVADLLESERVPALPVIDRDGTPLGVVSHDDLCRAKFDDLETDDASLRAATGERLPGGFHLWRSAGLAVKDVFVPSLFQLETTTPVTTGAALLAFEGVEALPVVSRGRVVGLLTLMDIAQWVAQQDGYLMPGWAHA